MVGAEGGKSKIIKKALVPSVGWLVLSGRGKGKALEKDAYPAQDLSKSDPKVAAPRSEKVPWSLQDHILRGFCSWPKYTCILFSSQAVGPR